MKLLTSNDIDYDNVQALGQVFLDSGLNAVAKEPDGFGNARVDITFPSSEDDIDLNIIVMVWVPSRQPDALRFRTVLLDRKERDELKKNDDLWKDILRVANMLNGNAFGFLSLSNMVGITLDYCLTIEGGIASSTLSNTAKEVAKIAQGAKSTILYEVSFAE
ncbi:MAG: hypothetical protein Q9N02_11880 [Ghiorsea sp.]|nr:hypothetical protein [Ghiorsea sp.]